jgi:glycine dehydrogenase subunit 1
MPHFNEFVVKIDKGGKTAVEVNQALLDRDIFGGKDLSDEFTALGQSILFCISEIHSQADIDRLVSILKEVVK